MEKEIECILKDSYKGEMILSYIRKLENALNWHTYPNEIPETKFDEDMEIVVSENVLVKDSYGDILIDKIIKCDDGNFAWLTSPNEVKQWRYIYG